MGAPLAVSAGGFGRLSRGPRRQVLPDYAAWVQRQGQTDESAERRYCLLITRAGPDAVTDHVPGSAANHRDPRAIALLRPLWR